MYEHMDFDVQKIRKDFPILSRKVNGKQLVYLDNAATSQTPKVVIDTITDYYSNFNSNIHRGVHQLSQEATDAYELARKKIQNHFNAAQTKEIILTSGTTHGINTVAYGFSGLLQKGDELVVSALEHHANIVPWQMLCDRTGAVLKVIPIDKSGRLQIEKLDLLLTNRTKLVFATHVSNTLGIINPIEILIDKAHQVDAAILIDGAQSAAHFKVDLQRLDVDFYVASAHKLCGPTGIGMLYGKRKWLDQMHPFHGGGEMIDTVTFEKTTFADLPHKFEAGTPNISGGIAFGAALDYLNSIGLEAIQTYENSLLAYATAQLSAIDGIVIYGKENPKTAVISFNLKGIHHYDLGSVLDQLGVAVRTGHHCTQPIMDFFEIPGTVRASFAFYNTYEEIDTLVQAVRKAQSMFA